MTVGSLRDEKVGYGILDLWLWLVCFLGILVWSVAVLEGDGKVKRKGLG